MTLPLEVDALEVRAKDGRRLLDVPGLRLSPGACLGIAGPSGAGKSTLLHALAGLIDDAAGGIRWGETDILGLSPGGRAAFRARHVGLIFQDFLLFEELGPVANASLHALFAPAGTRGAIADAARATLQRLGVPVERRTVETLSGGERQRVAVSRALANRPGILLADEPTASLHREAADALGEDLVAMARAEGRTLIVVSHDAALLDRMDRVLQVSDGAIAEPLAA